VFCHGCELLDIAAALIGEGSACIGTCIGGVLSAWKQAADGHGILTRPLIQKSMEGRPNLGPLRSWPSQYTPFRDAVDRHGAGSLAIRILR